MILTGGGFNTPLSRLLSESVVSVDECIRDGVSVCVWLCSVVGVDICIYLILTGGGFNTPLSRLLSESVVSIDECIRDGVSVCVWLCSVVRSCATQDDVNRDYVPTPTTSPGINCPSHLRPSRTYPKL